MHTEVILQVLDIPIQRQRLPAQMFQENLEITIVIAKPITSIGVNTHTLDAVLHVINRSIPHVTAWIPLGFHLCSLYMSVHSIHGLDVSSG